MAKKKVSQKEARRAKRDTPARRTRTTKANAWTNEARVSSVDNLFASAAAKSQDDTGLDVSVGTEAQGNLIGLYLPALCLRVLLQSTTFPLSKLTQITGEEGSCKTSLLVEIMRWHMLYGGGADYIENENKDTPEMRNSLLRWDPKLLRRVYVTNTTSVEEWQDVMTSAMIEKQKQMDAAGGPGRTIPLCIGIDSLMGTAPEAELDNIEKDGHAAKGYAIAAQLITRYTRGMPKLLKQWPFSIIGINHLKPGTDYMGRPLPTVPGGKSVKFHEQLELEIHKGGDIDLTDKGGIRLKIVARKNGMGPSRRQIGVELLWWREKSDQDGEWRQHSAFDWNTATIEFLLGLENAKNKKGLYKDLVAIHGIEATSKRDRKAFSKVLGIPKSDPQEWRIVAAELEKRPDILKEMYPLLDITERFVFTPASLDKPAKDYRKQLEQARKKAAQSVEHLYTDVGEMPILNPADVAAFGDCAVAPEAPKLAEEPDTIPESDEIDIACKKDG